MTKQYYDLYVRVPEFDTNICEEVVRLIKQKRYSGFSTAIQINPSFTRVTRSQMNFLEYCAKVAEHYGLDFVKRLDIRLKRVSAIKRFLQRYRRKFEVISVLGLNREVISFSSRDNRIDIITFYPSKNFKLLKGDIEYIKNGGKHVEFLISYLRECKSNEQPAYRLSLYRKNLELIERKKIIPIFSSGIIYPEFIPDSLSVIDFYEMLGVKRETIIRGLSDDIKALIDKNRKKIMGKMVSPGVEVLDDEREKKVCDNLS